MTGTARLAARLLAGILLFDLLTNAPGFSSAGTVSSLLAPSLDLLVALALLMGVSHAAPGSRGGLALGVSIVLVLILGWEAVERLGPGAAARLVGEGPVMRRAAFLAAAVAVFAAGVLASFFISKLVLDGFAVPLLRNVFLAAAAACAVIQALTGLRIFSPSEVPRIIGEIIAGPG